MPCRQPPISKNQTREWPSRAWTSQILKPSTPSRSPTTAMAGGSSLKQILETTKEKEKCTPLRQRLNIGIPLQEWPFRAWMSQI